MISRRAYLAISALGLLVAPLAAAAQQPPARVARVGVFALSPREPGSPSMRAFFAQLREMGYLEGQNLVIEYRHALDKEGYRGLANELVALKADVIFAGDPYALRASREATASIPIVAYDLESDPVASGFAASLARPGGNITGAFLDQPELSAKQLQLLREAVPRLTRVAVLWDSPAAELQFTAVEEAAQKLGMRVHSIVWRGPGELPDAFRRATRDGAQALIVLSSPQFSSLDRVRRLIVDAALRSRLPSIYLQSAFAEAGGLMAYGPDQIELRRSAAKLVARILAGASPGELPIERPTRFDFVINAKTAKALGLTLPPSLVYRANRILD